MKGKSRHAEIFTASYTLKRTKICNSTFTESLNNLRAADFSSFTVYSFHWHQFSLNPMLPMAAIRFQFFLSFLLQVSHITHYIVPRHAWSFFFYCIYSYLNAALIHNSVLIFVLWKCNELYNIYYKIIEKK